MHRELALVLALAALPFAGCSSAPKPVRAFSAGRIAEVNVITAPVGLNLDGKPGVDGFSMKVYANDESHPKTVAIPGGALEILMFNGTFYGRTNVLEPSRIWRFESADLPNHQVQSSIGVGYEFVLAWGTDRPTERLITVQARYTDPKGRVVLSPPSSVTVLER